MGCFLLSLEYFDVKETVKKRQPHKRKAEQVVKKESVKMVFEKFLELKVKQNLRPNSLNQHVGLFKNINTFHEIRSDRSFYLTDITTEFISDYVYWLKNEVV